MTSPPFPIIYEDNHLLVIDKPAGLATQGVTNVNSVSSLARKYLGDKYQKPGNVYLGIVSRLDTVTCGVLVLARTSKAASRLSEQLRQGTVQKRYRAVVEGTPQKDAETWTDFLRKDDAAHRMVICDRAHVDAKQAQLRYRVVKCFGEQTLLDVELLTGRKHQIRVQCSRRGLPVVGDRKYGAQTRFGNAIALQAYAVTIEHPTRRQPLRLELDPPKTWSKWT